MVEAISTHASLDEAINACTNNPWTLYINKGIPASKYSISMSLSAG